MSESVTPEELKEKAMKPAQDALKMHPYYQGKVQVMPRCVIRDFQDFGIWYSPGVAAPCLKIKENGDDDSLIYTHRWNTVAVVSDGTRVLGLGNIGPYAGMPVMEGKALLFKYLGGVDAWPLCIGPNLSAEQIIQVVKWVQPTFGGINLEDIEKPKCFQVLDTLRADPEVTIPVWHDDQQGTACVTLAGAMNALKIVGKKRDEVKVVLFGTGASNTAIGRILSTAGFDSKKCVFVDSQGIVSLDRTDLDEYKTEIAQKTNGEGLTGTPDVAFNGADMAICLSTPGPNTVPAEWVRSMATDAILFVCANPTPEIWPWEAKEAGALIVATGRSDFPNQVNNSIGFPGIFRGTLDVRAKTITDEMCIAAAEELAAVQEDKGLDPDHIVPTMDDWEVFIREAVAVGLKAEEQGIARISPSKQELWDTAAAIIKNARDSTQLLMREGLIRPYEE
ncbi:MAG TPA: NADP-dependent malic enzyme [Candidatus Lokiarchaeia archaeon]|nr:NADP-dependent malic enzyme [Candidatus Lokiarchaeia archaeon]